MGDSATITWLVNATGTIDTPYEFFVYGNLTSNMTINNDSSKLNITIKDITAPVINITYPANETYSVNISTLNYTYSDVNGGGSCWYSTNGSNSSLVDSPINFTNVNSHSENNTWFLFCNDSSGNFANDSVDFNVRIPTLDLNLIHPSGDVNLTQNDTLLVEVNIECSVNDCGEVNLTLDPELDLVLFNDTFEDNAFNDEWTTTGTAGVSTSCAINGTYSAYHNGNAGAVTSKIIDLDGKDQANISYFVRKGSSGCGETPDSGEDLYVEYLNSSSDWVALDFFQATAIGSGSVVGRIRNLTGDAFHSSFQVRFRQTGGSGGSYDYWFFDTVNITGIGAKGIISNDTLAVPFFTNVSNPYSINLSQDSSATVKWWVNASGNINSTYEFFVYANRTSDLSNGVSTEKWNVTIVEYPVDNDPPVVTVISPAADSGDDGNVTFSYSVTDEGNLSNCSLILNNIINQTNTSVVENATQYFYVENMSVGSYNWSINCTDNNSNSRISQSHSLGIFANIEFLGDSTNLSQINLTNVTNFVLDVASYGSINFTESLDLSGGGDFDTHVEIASNHIEINSSALPALNKSAILTLRDLTFSDPQILKDGVLCSAPDCNEISYVGNDFVFNVSGFTIYSASEGAAGGGPGGGSSPGGGSRAVSADVDEECKRDSDCDEGYTCYYGECVKLFDVEILDVQPLIDSLSFEVEYLIKGMADINGDVIINYWIENSLNKIELGRDTIYLGSFEEKIRTVILNLPADVLDGSYDLFVGVSFENYDANSFRKINTELLKDANYSPDVPVFIYIFFIFQIILTVFILIVLYFFWRRMRSNKVPIVTKEIVSEKKALPKINIAPYFERVKNEIGSWRLKERFSQLSIQKEKVRNKVQSWKVKERINPVVQKVKSVNYSKYRPSIKKPDVGKIKFGVAKRFGFGLPKQISKVSDCVRISEMDGKIVYNKEGKKLGRIEKGIISNDNKVFGFVIVPPKKKAKKILMKYDHIGSVGDVVIVDDNLNNNDIVDLIDRKLRKLEKKKSDEFKDSDDFLRELNKKP